MEHRKEIIQYKDWLVQWIRDWFEKNGPDCNAVVGISGGKDSTTVAALCCEALDPWRVIGVLMPNGKQKDIQDSYEVVKHLNIRYAEINIEEAYNGILRQFPGNNILESEQTKINLGPRLRMATLYAVSQSMNGRVVGTGNASEGFAGFCTRYGDNANDINPLAKLTKEEVVELGLALGVPEHLMTKPPSDGLTGMTDDDKFAERGFSYDMIHKYIKEGSTGDPEKDELLEKFHEQNKFKTHMGDAPYFTVEELYCIESTTTLT